jgi:heat shock protein HspQ
VIAREARFRIGEVVRHRFHPFRGVIFDVDATFSNTEEWWLSIPEEVRPRKDQPYYHLLAVSERGPYIAYVSEQNLLPDPDGGAVAHPSVPELFGELKDGHYTLRSHRAQ